MVLSQPTLSCHNTSSQGSSGSGTRLMVLVYPVGVPLLFYVVLFSHRDKIKRVMLVVKGLMGRFEETQVKERDIPEMSAAMSQEGKDALEKHMEALFKVVRHLKNARRERRRTCEQGAERRSR